MNVSYLYTPVLRADSLVTNRHSLDADVLVFDLEDSTHINAKAQARQKLSEFDFTPLTELGLRIGLRINGIATFDGLQDVALVRAMAQQVGCPIEYVFLPKVDHEHEVKIYRALLGSLPGSPKLYTFIETIEAVENVDAIARVSDALCFGQADLVSEMYSPNEAFIDYARARMCIAAAKCGIEAVDTNSFELHDLDMFEEQCETAKAYGFTGKAAIHPRQVAAINRVFRVSEETVRKYEATVDAYLHSDVGFRLVDGQVIALPFVVKAQRMLDLYKK